MSAKAGKIAGMAIAATMAAVVFVFLFYWYVARSVRERSQPLGEANADDAKGCSDSAG
jgi:hypothetical protein